MAFVSRDPNAATGFMGPTSGYSAWDVQGNIADWMNRYLFGGEQRLAGSPGEWLTQGAVDTASMTPAGLLSDAYTAGGQVGKGDLAAAGITSLLAAAPGPPVKPKGIRAFHGSPHDFERFDIGRIGTGEGAQAYGHGLYFAENERVAKEYRDALADAAIQGQPFNINNPVHAAVNAVDQAGSREEAIVAVRQRLQRDPDPFNEQVLSYLQSDLALPKLEKTGKMYEVNIAADPEHFLDWDKPLSEQSEQVRERLRQALPQSSAEDLQAQIDALDEQMQAVPLHSQQMVDLIHQRTQLERQRRYFEELERSTGRNVYDLLGGGPRTQETATETLRQAGIPGIRYLDQGSRVAGEGSRNYVLFDDALIEIMRKYGIAGLLGTGAAAAAMRPDQAQARQ